MKRSEEPRDSVRLPYALLLGAAWVALVVVYGLMAPHGPLSPGENAVPESAEGGSAGPGAVTRARHEAATRTALQPEMIREENSPLSDLRLAFKLDPRLTRSLYMGDRWVSPPTYTRVGEGLGCTVEMTVEGIDLQGKPVSVNPEWRIEEADMVSVSPGVGNQVTLAVQRAGQTSLEVTAFGITKRLVLSATDHEGSLLAELSQPPSPVVQLASAGPTLPARQAQADSGATPLKPMRPRRHVRPQPAPIPAVLGGPSAQTEADPEQSAASISEAAVALPGEPAGDDQQ